MADGHTAEYGNGPTLHFAQKRIYWMSSPDGVNWTQQGALSDPSTGVAIRTVTDEVNAAYDPTRKAFIVVWLDDLYNARYMVFPGPTSALPGTYYGVLSGSGNGTYWEVPSVACSGVQCMIVGAARDVDGNSFLQYRRTSLATVGPTGAISVSSYGNELTTAQTLAPSLAYVPWDNTYVTAFVGRDGQSLQVSKTAAGFPFSWPVASTIAFYGTSALLPPAAGSWVCPGLCEGHVTIGVVKYGP